MARAFNMREGLTRADDVLPLRMRSPHKSGTVNEKPVDPEELNEAVTMFYGMMGWDPRPARPRWASCRSWISSGLMTPCERRSIGILRAAGTVWAPGFDGF